VSAGAAKKTIQSELHYSFGTGELAILNLFLNQFFMLWAERNSPKAWKTKLDRPITLEIVLLKRTYILPWTQFLYAEGSNDEVRIAFATHDVVVKGSRLEALLADLAAQRIARLEEPTRADAIQNGSEASSIREIFVWKTEEGCP
jgi:hypothetical protein